MPKAYQEGIRKGFYIEICLRFDLFSALQRHHSSISPRAAGRGQFQPPVPHLSVPHHDVAVADRRISGQQKGKAIPGDR